MESFDITPDLKMKLNKAQRARVALEQAVFDFVDERFHGTIDATTRNAHQWKRACDLMFGHNYCWKQWEVMNKSDSVRARCRLFSLRDNVSRRQLEKNRREIF